MTKQPIIDRIMQGRPAHAEPANESPQVVAPAHPSRAREGILWGLLAALVVGGMGRAAYEFSTTSGLVGSAVAETKPAADSASSKQPANVFAQQADKGGVKTCRNVFEALGGVLAANTEHMAMSEWAEKDANSHAIRSLVGMKYDTPGYKSEAAGVVFAAPVGDKCEGSMVRVAPYPLNCQEVAAILPKGSTGAANLTGVAVFNLATGGQALLVPQQNGCIAVSVVSMSG